MRFNYMRAAALAAAMITGSAALADRIPNVQEQAKIEAALEAAGYTGWTKIRYDNDGYWEVDNATDKNGASFDVELAQNDLRILKREASDDRAPTKAERAKLEASLKAAGFTRWKSIELENNHHWEVDDARHTDGFRYDLHLDKDSMKIVKKNRDD